MHAPTPRGLILFWTQITKAIQTGSTTYRALSSCSWKFSAVRDDPENRQIKIIFQMSKAREKAAGLVVPGTSDWQPCFPLLCSLTGNQMKTNYSSAWLPASISARSLLSPNQTSSMFEDKLAFFFFFTKLYEVRLSSCTEWGSFVPLMAVYQDSTCGRTLPLVSLKRLLRHQGPPDFPSCSLGSKINKVTKCPA